MRAHKSSKYSYWPVVLTIANYCPSERYHLRNMLHVVVIPGPNNPKYLNSFLLPFIQEIQNLSTNGVVLTMYDGKRTLLRVHLLFVLGDLSGIAKLCYLLGHNSNFPCRFCCIKGIWVPGSNHVYYPNVIIAVGDSSGECEEYQREVLWDPKNRDQRTDA